MEPSSIRVSSYPPIVSCTAQELVQYPNICRSLLSLSEWGGDYYNMFRLTCSKGAKRYLPSFDPTKMTSCFPFDPQWVCHSIFVFYVEGFIPSLSASFLEDVEKRFSQNIVSALNLIWFDSDISKTVEIWNVYTLPLYRSKGIMSRMISYIGQEMDQQKMNIWLSVDVDNPLFDQVCKLYLKSGFRTPVLTTLSQHDHIISSQQDKRFIGMIRPWSLEREPRSEEDIMQDLLTCQKLRIQKQNEIKRFPVYLPLDIIMKKPPQFLSLETEIVSVEAKSKKIDTNLLFQKPVIRVKLGDQSSSSSSVSSSLPIELVRRKASHHKFEQDKYIQSVSKKKPKSTGYFAGYPSGEECSRMVQEYMESLPVLQGKGTECTWKKFFISEEGVYSLQLHPSLQTFLFKMYQQNLRDYSTIKSLLPQVIYNQVSLWYLDRHASHVSSLQSIAERMSMMMSTITFSRLLTDTEFPSSLPKDSFDPSLVEVWEQKRSELMKMVCSFSIDQQNDFPLFIVHFFSQRSIKEREGLVDILDVSYLVEDRVKEQLHPSESSESIVLPYPFWLRIPEGNVFQPKPE